MAAAFRVQPAEVVTQAARLSTASGDLGGIDLGGPLSQAAGAVTGSSLAAAAGKLAGTVTTHRDSQAAAVEVMAEAASTTAANYVGVDRHCASELKALVPALTTPVQGPVLAGGASVSRTDSVINPLGPYIGPPGR